MQLSEETKVGGLTNASSKLLIFVVGTHCEDHRCIASRNPLVRSLHGYTFFIISNLTSGYLPLILYLGMCPTTINIINQANRIQKAIREASRDRL